MTSTRKTLWILIGLVAAVVLAVALWPRSEHPSIAEQTRSLASELRCVDCEGLSVADSSAASARLVRRDIARRLRRGESIDAIRQHYVDNNGESILLKPPGSGVGMLVWALPIVAVLIAAGGLAMALRCWQRQPRLTATADDEELVARHRHDADPAP